MGAESVGQQMPVRVFLVEDSAPVREIIIESLEEVPGIDVVGFSEGERAAFKWLQSEACDVLIVDVELKEGNGMSLLRSLHLLDPALPLTKIICSNHVTGEYRRAGMQYGVKYFFDKSSEFLEMLGLLEKLAHGSA